MNNPLKLALLISHTGEIPEWELVMIRNLQDSRVIIIEALITDHKSAVEQINPGIQLFKKFEKWWFRSVPDAFSKFKVDKEFNEVPVIDISDTPKISELGLDIIYSSCALKGQSGAESLARYGVWCMGFGPQHSNEAEKIAFWQVMNNQIEIGIHLFIKTTGNPDIICVYEGSTTTVPFSVKNTLSTVGWKSSSIPGYRLSELIRTGGDAFFRKYKKVTRDFQKEVTSDVKRYPGNLKLAGLFLRNIFRYLRYKSSGIFRKGKFTVLYSGQKQQLPKIDSSGFIPLHLPRGSFWADPFVVEKDQKIFIFFEEYLYKKGKAHISVLELGRDGHYSKPEIALERPYHLSYPFIFESGGNLYMIPETTIRKNVELYRCAKFPLQWDFVQNLMENISLHDPTLLYYQEKWWLFGTCQNHSCTSPNDQLFLFYNNSFLSADWVAHPQNPIVTKVSNCRPAGNIFESGGKLYRPAQNNASSRYGFGLKINEIEILNEFEYREKEVFEIVPGKGNHFSAIHTFSRTGDLIIIDGIV